MEAIHHDAHLLKENVEATVGGAQQNKLRFGGDKATTPKRPFQIHSDVTSTGKKGLKDSTSEKRRILGDISNQHRNRYAGDGPSENAVRKKKSLKSGVRKSELRIKTPVSKRVALSQIKSNAVPVTKPTEAQAPQAQSAKVEEVEEIEHAYGGLTSLKPSASYLASLREEMINDIVHSKTSSLIDDYEPSEAFGVWDNEEEHRMLESGAPPSAWWSQATAEYTEDTSADPLWNDTESNALSLLEDVPAPDDFSDPLLDDNENDDDLDELLNVDIDAACQ